MQNSNESPEPAAGPAPEDLECVAGALGALADPAEGKAVFDCLDLLVDAAERFSFSRLVQAAALLEPASARAMVALLSCIITSDQLRDARREFEEGMRDAQ